MKKIKSDVKDNKYLTELFSASYFRRMKRKGKTYHYSFSGHDAEHGLKSWFEDYTDMVMRMFREQ